MKSLLQTIAEQLTESAEVAKQTELPPVELKPVVPGLIDQKIELAHMYNEFRLAEQRVANGTLNEMEPGARYIRDLNLRKIDIIREKFDSKFKDLLGIQDISEINDLDEAFDILEGKKPNNSKANLPKGDDEFKDLWDQEYGTEYHGGKEQREKDVAAAKAAFLKRFPSKPLKKEEVEQIDEAKNEVGYIKHKPEGGKHGYGTYHGEYLGHSFEVATKHGNTTARQVAAENPHLKQHAADIAKHIRSYENRSHEKISRRFSIKKEEVEQIDELKKSTVDSYLTKSTGSNLQARDAKTVARNAVSGKKKPNMTLVALAKVGRVPPFMKKHAKAKIAATNEEASVSYIEEKLTAADPANKWVSDFVHSENPKFASKSKKERINMALGAYYAAKRGMKEEVEQIDELKKSTLASYIGKAAGRVASASRLQKDFERDGQYELAGEFEQTAKKRRANIGKAANKLAKEEVEQVDEAAKSKFVHAKEVPDPKGLLDKPKAVKAYDKEGNLVGRYRSMNHAKQMKPGHTYKVEEEVEQVEEKYMGFKKLKAAIAAKGGARDPAAVAAAIGRKKYGKEKFQAMAAAGKKMAKEEAEGKVAVTPKEKALAAHHGDPKRITYGDVIKARIKSAKK